jgi:carboxypeptidase C (cathepsin A)
MSMYVCVRERISLCEKYILICALTHTGLTNPEIQYQFYPDMAISTNDHLPAVDNKTYERMVASVGPCVKLIQNCNAGNDQACTRAYDFCNEALMGPYESKGLNPYDMRKQCGDNPLCYNFTATDVFYNDPDVQAALGVDVKWESCNMQVNQQFGLDWMHEFQDRIVSLLASNIPVTIYAGDQDYVCNWLGNYAYVEKLDWPGQEDWSNSPVVDWVVDGSVAGTYRTSGGLTFVRVFKAGHMVPMDQPEAASDLIQTITKPGAWE